MARLKRQLKKGKFKPTKKEGNMDVIENRKGISAMECNTALTMQYTFLSKVLA